jgi:predicted negative regulator of RcsB-dependent stress response
VSVHLSEEEQLEVLKRWWKEYGKTVVIATVVAVAGYFAFTAWQDQQREKREAASNLYEDLLQIVSSEQAVGEAGKTTAVHLASQLKEADSSSLYAHNAAFILARLAVAENNLDEAAEQLTWVLDNKPAPATEQVARLRLARVLLSQQAYDDAEKLLTTPVEAFKSDYAEIRADINKARGNIEAARAGYEEALAATDPQQQERMMLLQLKRDDLKAPATVTQQAPTETAQ